MLNVAVCSFSDASAKLAARSSATIVVKMNFISLTSVKKWRPKINTKCEHHQSRRHPERRLDDPICHCAGTNRTFNLRLSGFSVDLPKPKREKRDSNRDEHRLIRFQGGQTSDPRPAHTQRQQNQWPDAA